MRQEISDLDAIIFIIKNKVVNDSDLVLDLIDAKNLYFTGIRAPKSDRENPNYLIKDIAMIQSLKFRAFC
jgi:hypothetical protein